VAVAHPVDVIVKPVRSPCTSKLLNRRQGPAAKEFRVPDNLRDRIAVMRDDW
jgi:hypothetical protein